MRGARVLLVEDNEINQEVAIGQLEDAEVFVDLAENGAEAVRMVPGMYVGRLNSSSWIVGSLGMAASAITANRDLVVIDGRIAHDALLSTTFWDSNDRVVDDIDRIEVIRGPGAKLWGQNAMNGVVSVITRDAAGNVATGSRSLTVSVQKK